VKTEAICWNRIRRFAGLAEQQRTCSLFRFDAAVRREEPAADRTRQDAVADPTLSGRLNSCGVPVLPVGRVERLNGEVEGAVWRTARSAALLADRPEAKRDRFLCSAVSTRPSELQ